MPRYDQSNFSGALQSDQAPHGLSSITAFEKCCDSWQAVTVAALLSSWTTRTSYFDVYHRATGDKQIIRGFGNFIPICKGHCTSPSIMQ